MPGRSGDPFLAAVEKQTGARVLVDGRNGVANNYLFYLAERKFVQKNGDVIQALFADSQEQGRWLKADLKRAAAIIAPLQGLDPEIVELALRRYNFNVTPLSEQVAAQAAADRRRVPRAQADPQADPRGRRAARGARRAEAALR